MLIICLGISYSLSFYTTAGNTTGGNLTSDTNRAIARSIATHAKEEKVREVYKEDQLSLGKRESEKDYWSKCE